MSKKHERAEMPSNGRIRAVAQKWALECPNAMGVIKDLFPETFWKKK